MKPVLEYLPRRSKESFVVKDFDYGYYPTPWHYHPEYEIVLVTESTGKRFIGDHIKDFAPGDLAFIGPNVPHLYRNDEKYYAIDSTLRAKSIVVHFLDESFGKDFLMLPEAEKILQLFARSSHGLELLGDTNGIVSELLLEMTKLQGLARWLKLVEVLSLIAESDEYRIISSQIITGRNDKDSDRLNSVVELVMKSYQKEIQLQEIARAVNMSPPSFSRYFKQRTRKTFSEFVTQMRLGHATKLLQEDVLSVTEICYESGFNNLSNFNRHFKETYRMSPLIFRKQYRNRK